MIAAMANNRVIGKDNQMPWHLPADLKFFKNVTMGKPILMGRNTYESIGRPLPGRENIIISRNEDYKVDGASVFPSIEAALTYCRSNKSHDEVMIIGGGAIYKQALPHADNLYLTYIDLDTDGDTFFPDHNEFGVWDETFSEAHHSDEKNAHNYVFKKLEKREVAL